MFTLAHLSDVHLSPMPKLRGRDLIGRRMFGFLNWQRRKQFHQRAVLDLLTDDLRAQAPDHIAVTGDIINIGAPEEYVRALAWLESLGPADRVTVAPGNHDAYVHSWWETGMERWVRYMESNPAGLRFAAPGGGDGPGSPSPLSAAPAARPGPAAGSLRRASRLFRPGRWRGGAQPGERFPFVRVLGDGVALIGLSSAAPTLPTLASGRLGAAQIERLAVILAALGREGLCRIVLIHHPPLPGMTDWSRALHDAADLAAILRRFGAELVIHGHHHRHTIMRLALAGGASGASVPVVGAPSASAARRVGRKPAARFNLYHIEREGGRWRIELVARALHEENFAAHTPAFPLFHQVERLILSGDGETQTRPAAGPISAVP